MVLRKFLRVSKDNNLRIFLVFLIIGFTLYINSIKNNFVFSDHYLILKNYLVRSFSFLPYYLKGYIAHHNKGFMLRPLTMLSYNFNYFLSDYKVWSYRLLNISLHILNAFLVYLILKKLSPSLSSSAIFLSSMLFLLHPINTAVVNYLTARSELIATLMILSSFACYLYWEGKSFRLFLSYTLFALGLLSKEYVVLFVPFLFLYNILKRKLDKGEFLILLPFVFISSLYLIYWNYLFKDLGLHYRPFILNFLTQLKVLLFYIYLFFLPKGLSFDHQYLEVRSVREPLPWMTLAVLLLIIWLAFRREGRSLRFPLLWLLCFYSWKFFTQLRLIGMEHHFYLPQIGLIFLISTWLEELLKRPKLFYVLLTIFLFLGAITVLRNSVWKDEVSLSWDMLAKNPDSLIGNYQIGLKYLKDGEYPRALLYLKRVLALNPDDELKIKTMVLLAQAKFGMGEVGDALRILKGAIRKYPQSPPLYKELERICLLRSELDLEEEIKDLSKNAVLLYHLGEYHYKRGDLDKAEFYLKEALSLSPWNSSVYYLLSAIYERKGAPDMAIRYYTRCVELDPFNKLANYNLGTLLAQRGDPGCIVYLKRATKLDPAFAQAFYNLGLFYLQMGDSKKAALYLAKANRLGYPISDDE